MISEDKEAIKLEIKNRIDEAESSLATLREQTAPVPPSVAIGRLTRMDAIQQKNMAEANLKSTEALIKKLNQALALVNEADFGICGICKGKILLGRILAVPESKVCVQCASKKRF